VTDKKVEWSRYPSGRLRPVGIGSGMVATGSYMMTPEAQRMLTDLYAGTPTDLREIAKELGRGKRVG